MGDDSGDETDVVEVASEHAAVVERPGDPPVVARLVVEIRSDGTRTIARGAIEDKTLGQSVAIEARGESPISLALALAKSMLKVPSLGRTTARALLPGRRRLFKKK